MPSRTLNATLGFVEHITVRVGRLIMFKECLANNIVPFIITDEPKLFYYRGLSEWGQVNGYLTDTSLTAQDQYKALLDYFKIRY
jgi:hypothetical protein